MSHHEEKGTSFCLHSGLLVPYDVAKGNIRQISVKLIKNYSIPIKASILGVQVCLKSGLGKRHFLIDLNQYQYCMLLSKTNLHR